MSTFSEDADNGVMQEIEPVLPNGSKKRLLVVQDESTFNANDDRKMRWKNGIISSQKGHGTGVDGI